MPIYIAKPLSSIWQPDRAPAGCRLYLTLGESWGAVTHDLCRAGGKDGSFVGTPAWGRGVYGPQLGGFSTLNYIAVDPPAPILFAGAYPFWVAILVVNTSTSAGWPIAQATTANSTGVVGFRANNGGAGRVEYVVGDSPTYAIPLYTGASINDGTPHVLMGVSLAANAHRLYYDGLQVATSVTIPTAFAANTLSVGAWHGATTTAPFPGSVIAVAAGQGAVPDPTALAQDWLSGRFAAVRPRRPTMADLGMAIPSSINNFSSGIFDTAINSFAF